MEQGRVCLLRNRLPPRVNEAEDASRSSQGDKDDVGRADSFIQRRALQLTPSVVLAETDSEAATHVVDWWERRRDTRDCSQRGGRAALPPPRKKGRILRGGLGAGDNAATAGGGAE